MLILGKLTNRILDDAQRLRKKVAGASSRLSQHAESTFQQKQPPRSAPSKKLNGGLIVSFVKPKDLGGRLTYRRGDLRTGMSTQITEITIHPTNDRLRQLFYGRGNQSHARPHLTFRLISSQEAEGRQRPAACLSRQRFLKS